jgi:hypothetical protein
VAAVSAAFVAATQPAVGDLRCVGRTSTWRKSMTKPSDQEERFRPAADRRTSSELARLIRKLRWIGMEAEAEPLMAELTRRGTADATSVITPSRETD